MSRAVRIRVASHPAGDVVIIVPPGQVRRHVEAPPCANCSGRGLIQVGPERHDLEICETCRATGLQLLWGDR